MQEIPETVREFLSIAGKKGGRPRTVVHTEFGPCRCMECRKGHMPPSVAQTTQRGLSAIKSEGIRAQEAQSPRRDKPKPAVVSEPTLQPAPSLAPERIAEWVRQFEPEDPKSEQKVIHEELVCESEVPAC